MQQPLFESSTVNFCCLHCRAISQPIFYACCLSSCCTACYTSTHYKNCIHATDQNQHPIQNKPKTQCIRCQLHSDFFFYCTQCALSLCKTCSQQMHSKHKFTSHLIQAVKYQNTSKINNSLFQNRNTDANNFNTNNNYNNITYQSLREVFKLKVVQTKENIKNTQNIKKECQQYYYQVRKIIQQKYNKNIELIDKYQQITKIQQIITNSNELQKQMNFSSTNKNKSLQLQKIYRFKMQQLIKKIKKMNDNYELKLSKMNENTFEQVLKSFTILRRKLYDEKQRQSSKSKDKYNLNISQSSNQKKKHTKNVSCSKKSQKHLDFQYFVNNNVIKDNNNNHSYNNFNRNNSLKHSILVEKEKNINQNNESWIQKQHKNTINQNLNMKNKEFESEKCTIFFENNGKKNIANQIKEEYFQSNNSNNVKNDKVEDNTNKNIENIKNDNINLSIKNLNSNSTQINDNINNLSLLKMTDKIQSFNQKQEAIQKNNEINQNFNSNSISILLSQKFQSKIFSIQQLSQRFVSRKAFKKKESPQIIKKQDKNVSQKKKIQQNSLTLQINNINISIQNNNQNNNQNTNLQSTKSNSNNSSNSVQNFNQNSTLIYTHIDDTVTQGFNVLKQKKEKNYTTPNFDKQQSPKRNTKKQLVELENKNLRTPQNKNIYYKRIDKNEKTQRTEKNEKFDRNQKINFLKKHTPQSIKNRNKFKLREFANKVQKQIFEKKIQNKEIYKETPKQIVAKELLQSAPVLIDNHIVQPKKKIQYIDLRDRMKKPLIFKGK